MVIVIDTNTILVVIHSCHDCVGLGALLFVLKVARFLMGALATLYPEGVVMFQE